jgi:hypothetical protein
MCIQKPAAAKELQLSCKLQLEGLTSGFTSGERAVQPTPAVCYGLAEIMQLSLESVVAKIFTRLCIQAATAALRNLFSKLLVSLATVALAATVEHRATESLLCDTSTVLARLAGLQRRWQRHTQLCSTYQLRNP